MRLHPLLPTDLAPQAHELLCRTIELGLAFDQLRGAELSCFELLPRRGQLLEMKLYVKVAGFLFQGSFKEDSHIHLGTGQTRGLLRIVPELEEFASGLRAQETGQGASQAARRTNIPPTSHPRSKRYRPTMHSDVYRCGTAAPESSVDSKPAYRPL